MAWKVHLENLIRTGQMGYRMYVIREDWRETYSIMLPPTLKDMPKGTGIADDQSFLNDGALGLLGGVDVRGFLQAMSDAAWEIGIKPKQIEDNSNELKATKFHLEDMRSLAGVKK